MPRDDAFQGPLATVLAAQAGKTVGELRSEWAALLAEPDAALPVPSASDRRAWDPRTGLIDSATADDVVARAAAERGTPWPQPLASAAARVHRDGDRDGWEQLVFERQRRLSRAVVAAAVTEDEAFIDEAADGLWLLCEQSSWCWPAHDDTRERHGAVLATVTDPFLDLGAGEAVGQLAWADHVLGAHLDARYPGLRARLRHEARVRVIDPFLARDDWHWLGLDGHVHNWNAWIHGNVLVAALRLLDGAHERALRADVVRLAVTGLDRYVASLPEDGAIDEGYSYWWNGACRALEALDILTHATGGALDPVPHVPALRETVAFPHRCHVGGDWYLNLADGQARPPRDQPWDALHRAGRRAGDAAAVAHAASYRRPGAPAASEQTGLGRLLRGMTDAEWIAAAPAAAPLPRDIWLPSTQVLLARSSAGSTRGLTVAAKGGHNGENHNHNDVGSFIVAADGVPVLVDAGRPTYTKQTFGPRRYDIWTMQSSWHSVPEVRGTAQSPGARFAASDVVATVSDAVAALDLDISGAYDLAGFTRWHRRVALDRDADRVEVLDAWSLGGPETGAPTVVHLIIAGDVTLEEHGAHVAPVSGGASVRVGWPAGIRASALERPLDDPMLTDVWGAHLTRIELDVTGREHLAVTVEKDRREVQR